jgi:L-amino acid N-acyltransferase YncA
MWKLVFTENEIPRGVVLYDQVSRYWSFYLVPSTKAGKGFGRLMLSAFLVYAKQRGVKLIKASVNIDNRRSTDLHHSLGFKDVFVENEQLRMRKEL